MSRKKHRKAKLETREIVVIALAVLLAVLICAGILKVMFGILSPKQEEETTTSIEVIDEDTEAEKEDAEDPQSEENLVEEETGAQTEITKILVAENTSETDTITMGIDVSKFQGTIDWEKVADAGIDFAMVRVGYRTQSGGEIMEDTNARYNMQEATANGLKIGAYFFSTAISEAEAREEAKWVADYISQYQITYPVAYNCEGFENPDNRQYSLTKTERTDTAIAFLNARSYFNHPFNPSSLLTTF